MPDVKMGVMPPTRMPSAPLNYDRRIWAVEQYNELAAWIDQLPPPMKPPGWPGASQAQEQAQPNADLVQQLNKQVDDLSEQVAQLRLDNEDLQHQLDNYEAGYNNKETS